MKKSEAFRKAQEAVLGSNLPISAKTEVLGVLLWEEYFAKLAEETQEKKESAE
jgi:hypothetical protein